MIRNPGDNGGKINGDDDKRMIAKGQKIETASELGVVDANRFIGVRIRPIPENEVRRLVDEARFHIIGIK